MRKLPLSFKLKYVFSKAGLPIIMCLGGGLALLFTYVIKLDLVEKYMLKQADQQTEAVITNAEKYEDWGAYYDYRFMTEAGLPYEAYSFSKEQLQFSKGDTVRVKYHAKYPLFSTIEGMQKDAPPKPAFLIFGFIFSAVGLIILFFGWKDSFTSMYMTGKLALARFQEIEEVRLSESSDTNSACVHIIHYTFQTEEGEELTVPFRTVKANAFDYTQEQLIMYRSGNPQRIILADLSPKILRKLIYQLRESKPEVSDMT